MKKVVFLIASFLLIGFGSMHAQKVLKFKSFDFYKGVVSSDNGGYDSFTFMIKQKSNYGNAVGIVLVDGVPANYSIEQNGVFKTYTVYIPKWKNIKIGEEFVVTINFVLGGFIIPKFLSSVASYPIDNGSGGFVMPAFFSSSGASPNNGGPGGPGGGGDPTVIIIKYP